MARTDRQLDKERPGVSDERRKAREKGGERPAPTEPLEPGDDGDRGEPEV